MNSSVSKIPVCIAVSGSDEENPERLQLTLSGHVTDRRGQWAEWWLASASQPCECSASYGMTQRWNSSALVTHITQTPPLPPPHCNLPPPCIVRNGVPPPCIVRNGVWYCVKYQSLKSFYVLQSHPASIPNHEMKFCGSVVWVRWQQIENVFHILMVSVRCSYSNKSAKPGVRVDILYVQKSTKTV